MHFKTKFTLFSIIIIIILFAVSCAQIGTITGGPKDEDPPKIKESLPADKSSNFKGEKITIVFDEYFQLDDINSKFLMSPMVEEKPEIKINGKKLIIKFDKKLEDSTTYSLIFNDAIKDFHEGNKIEDFRFVVSTGDYVDSMEISGTLKDAFTLEAQESVYVMLYRSDSDSIPLKEKPYYIARTNKEGEFKFDFIKVGKYKIFSLNDADANFIFNLPNENIAFIDSLIVPEIQQITKTDTLKAGTILHNANDSIQIDSLKNDSVVTQVKNIYSPKKLRLFSFIEDKQPQYVSNSLRDIKGKLDIEFAKPFDSLIFHSLDSNFNENKIIIEKIDTARIATIWLLDSTFFKADTLKFSFDYQNKDSAENIINETDTAIFVCDFKKDSTAGKYLKFVDLNKEHDYFKDFHIETANPIASFDTSKIKLYEIIDTMMLDPKKQQLIKIQRQSKDFIFANFKRSVSEKTYISPVNFIASGNWYNLKFSDKKDSLFFTINDSKIKNIDSLKIAIHYDNDFHLNQVQHFTDTFLLLAEKQFVKKQKRLSPDTILLSFNKPISNDFSCKEITSGKSNFYKKIDTTDKNLFLIKILDKKLEKQDTIKLSFKTFSYIDSLNKSIYLSDTLLIPYSEKRQKIKDSYRSSADELNIIFNKSLYSEMKISPLNFTLNNLWFKENSNTNRDSFSMKITDDFVAEMDTIKFAVNFKEKTWQDSIKSYSDTLIFTSIRKAKKEKKKKNKAGKKPDKRTKVTVEYNIAFSIKKDSVLLRQYNLQYAWKPKTNYLLKIDSLAFTDIFGKKNNAISHDIKVKDSLFYGQISLAVSNVKKITNADFYYEIEKKFIESQQFKKQILKTKIDSAHLDSTFSDSNLLDSTYLDSMSRITFVKDSLVKDSLRQDSVLLSKIEKGQIIVQLINKDNKITETKYITRDSVMVFNNLNPDEYSVKIIYDENSNGKWDTGNYLKHKQAERVLIFDKKITVGSALNSLEEWALKPE